MASDPLRGTANKSIAKPKLLLPLFHGSQTTFASPKFTLSHVTANAEALTPTPEYASKLEAVKSYYRDQLADASKTITILKAKLHKANEACREYRSKYQASKAYAKRLEAQVARGNGTHITVTSSGSPKPLFDSSLDEYGSLLASPIDDLLAELLAD